MTQGRVLRLASLATAVSVLAVTPAFASSHREAPFIAQHPAVDGTDFYMFRSYESGRSGFVTFVANYIPLQDPYGGPNYFKFDPSALYEIKIDNTGAGVPDLTFQFKFTNTVKGLTVPVNGVDVAIPLTALGQIGASGSAGDNASNNVVETYTVGLVRGAGTRFDRVDAVTNATTGAAVFLKPDDYIGTLTLPNYAAYANDHIFPINVPGCATQGRVFVGQRAESFSVNLGQVFDLSLHTGTITQPTTAETALVDQNTVAPFVPASASGSETNSTLGQNVIRNKNISTIALELPIACVTSGSEPVIGAWTTSSLPRATIERTMPDAVMRSALLEGEYVQVSRLGMPLVNEVVIGLPDKDKFNSSTPSGDTQFLTYVTNPSVPTVLQALYGTQGAVAQLGLVAPTLFPRADLVATFLTGIQGVNQPAHVTPGEMLRLNTSTPVTPIAQQVSLGVIGGDNAGFPNGRRPGDNIVDVTLRVAMGRLITLGLFGTPSQAPSGGLDFTDGSAGSISAAMFQSSFPYLNTPFPGNMAGGGG